MKKQSMLVFLLLCLLLAAPGCGTNDKQDTGNSKQVSKQTAGQPVNSRHNVGQSKDNGQPAKNVPLRDGTNSSIKSGAVQAKPSSGAKPAVIVKSTSNVSDQELKATYNEIDKELDSLSKELDNVDTPVECSPDLTDS